METGALWNVTLCAKTGHRIKGNGTLQFPLRVEDERDEVIKEMLEFLKNGTPIYPGSILATQLEALSK